MKIEITNTFQYGTTGNNIPEGMSIEIKAPIGKYQFAITNGNDRVENEFECVNSRIPYIIENIRFKQIYPAFLYLKTNRDLKDFVSVQIEYK